VTPVSTTGSSFTFYWVDQGNSRQVTYTYTMSNGQTASAAATFNIVGPTGSPIAKTVEQSLMEIFPPPNSFNPPGSTLMVNQGTSGAPGIQLQALASLPSGNAGKYKWAQLVQNDKREYLTQNGPSVLNMIPGYPELDGAFPYGYTSAGVPVGTVTKTSVPDDTSQDSSAIALPSIYGEFAREFSATMYLLWQPIADTRCSGTACAVPIPLTSVAWWFAGDAIDTQEVLQNEGYTFPQWNLNFGAYPGASSNGGFQAGTTYPTWKSTLNPL